MTKNGISIFFLSLFLVVLIASEGIIGTKVTSMSDAKAEGLTDGFYISQTETKFEDAVLDLENAVVNRGLVIDYKGKVGDMLERTQDAVEVKTPYKDAIYMHFCSAKHTHAVVAADPRNLAVCPYVIFAYSKTDDGATSIGYRRPVGVKSPQSDEAIAGIDAMLREIIDEASE